MFEGQNTSSDRVFWLAVCSHSLLSCLTLQPHGLYPPQPGFSVHGVFLARTLEWIAMPSSRDLPDPGTEPVSPALQADSLLLSHWRSPALTAVINLSSLLFFIIFLIFAIICPRSGFPVSVSGKELTCQCRRRKRYGVSPRVRKLSWRRAGNPPQYSCLENPETEEPDGPQFIGSQRGGHN